MKYGTKYLQNLILLIIGVMFLIPLLWLVLGSFNPQASQSLSIPKNFSLKNYTEVLTNISILRGFFMSLVIAGTQSIAVVNFYVVSLSSPHVMGLKRAQTITFSLLFLTAIPMTQLWYRLYQTIHNHGLVDSVFGTILLMTKQDSLMVYG